MADNLTFFSQAEISTAQEHLAARIERRTRVPRRIQIPAVSRRRAERNRGWRAGAAADGQRHPGGRRKRRRPQFHEPRAPAAGHPLRPAPARKKSDLQSRSRPVASPWHRRQHRGVHHAQRAAGQTPAVCRAGPPRAHHELLSESVVGLLPAALSHDGRGGDQFRCGGEHHRPGPRVSNHRQQRLGKPVLPDRGAGDARPRPVSWRRSARTRPRRHLELRPVGLPVQLRSHRLRPHDHGKWDPAPHHRSHARRFCAPVGANAALVSMGRQPNRRGRLLVE